ncbi:MAG: hypothetical protein WDM84_06660 [Bauldia sp.]
MTSYMPGAFRLPAAVGMARRPLRARRIFRLAIFIFTAASALCGFAHNLPMLLLARVLQGLGVAP